MWTLTWRLPEAPEDGLLYRALSGGDEVLRLSAGAEGLMLELRTVNPAGCDRSGRDTRYTFTVRAPGRPRTLTLCWLDASVRLYAERALCDEDWPLGQPAEGPWTEEGLIPARDAFRLPDEQEDHAMAGPMQFFLPEGQDTGVGDCMPFFQGGRFRLFYLLDRRAHRSKAGLGAHQWAQISSADLKTWTVHPLAIPIDAQWEGSICTGSLLEWQGRVYAFYAVRMSDGTAARLTWAVSGDGVHFAKSGRWVCLQPPYEPTSARDPMAFRGADGRFHMLVTTSRRDDAGEWEGCLAHLVSDDLERWTQCPEPFLTPGYPGQPECADYFHWNGWYYLVFSHAAVGRYRMSRSPFGPWIRPDFDLLDSPNLSVPKTAPFGDRRLVCGFLRRGPLTTYAGVGITHELVQRMDGTLGVKPCEEILPAFGEPSPLRTRVCAPEGRKAVPLFAAEDNFRLRATLKGTGLIALTLDFGDGQRAVLRFDPALGTVDLLLPGERESTGERRRCAGLPRENLQIDLFLHNGVLELFCSGGRCLTCWIERAAPVRVSLSALWGEAKLDGAWQMEKECE